MRGDNLPPHIPTGEENAPVEDGTSSNKKNTAMPADTETIEAAYGRISSACEQTWRKVGSLAGKIGNEGCDALTAECEEELTRLSAELKKLLEKMDALPASGTAAGATPAGSAPVPTRDDILTLKAKTDAVLGLVMNIPEARSAFRDHRRVIYQELGQWGRHFSTVRMTVLTFTLTTSAAIIAWKWQGKGPDAIEPLLPPVGVLWVAGVLVFWLFTYHTYKSIGSQKRMRDRMPDGIHSTKTDAGDVKFDWASVAVPVLSAGLWWLAWEKGLISNKCGNALWCGFVFVGVAVPCGIFVWLNRKAKGVRWTAIIIGVLALVAAVVGSVLPLKPAEQKKPVEKAPEKQCCCCRAESEKTKAPAQNDPSNGAVQPPPNPQPPPPPKPNAPPPTKVQEPNPPPPAAGDAGREK